MVQPSDESSSETPTSEAATASRTRRRRRGGPSSELGRRVTLGFTSVLLVAGGYAVISNLPSSNRVLLPPLQQIFQTLFDNMADGTLPSAIGASLQRVLLGYFIGASAAVVVGSFVGWFRTIEYLADPLIEAFRPIPPLAYIPLVIIWFGTGQSSRVLVITMASFLTCLVSVYAGMKQVPRVYVEAARTLGASRFRVFYTVAIPAATPFIFTGLRIALAAAWTTLVAAELVAAQNGLGFLLQSGRQFFQTDLVMATIIVIGLLAFTMDRIVRLAQARMMRWSEAHA